MSNINIGGADSDWENYFIQRKLESDMKEIYKTIDFNLISHDREKLSSQYGVIDKSKKHLADSNMSYWYHFRHSVSNGNKLVWYALSSYAHAILPGKLKQHAARGIITMYEGMKQWPHLRKAMYEISNKIDHSKK
jgi:hypothetical protein